MSNGKPSRWWPYIKGLASLVSVPADMALPGAGVGVRFLTDLQDDLARNGEETKGGIREALNDIRANTAAIVQHLAAEHLTVTDERLRAAAKDVAEALYLWQVANDYVYADFKGIEQQERVASLKLDDIFVDLKVVPERRTEAQIQSDRMEGKIVLYLRDAFDAGAMTSDKPTQSKSSLVDYYLRHYQGETELESTKDTRATPQSIDHILSRSGGVVLMGGPGSGKTTLVKRLARSCALGAEELKQRYPLLPWCFPVVLPISTFQTERGECGIYSFLLHRLTELGGEILREVFVERWAAGQCLMLLDGLDEVAEMAGRTRAARAVDELLTSAAGNRVVGYNITRLSVPAEHHILEPFSPQEIATFVRQWYLAHDRALHPDHPDPAQAAKDGQSLIDDVQKNPGVATLATNPLMLTIIALIKHANVVLPERRVELYETALKTLLISWNRARSLSKQVPVGEEMKLEKTKKLWAAVAYWMHSNVSRTISEAKLHEQLVRVLMEDFHEPQHQADDIASSYLAAARDRSGLLEARGPSTFAFVHQTFQEYLAAIHLAIPGHKAVAKIHKHAQDPRWHEAIRLAAGYIVIHQSDFETLGELMRMLLDDDDPLEPYLGTSLRLALACLSDEIGVQSADSDRLLVKVFDRLTGQCYEPLKQAFFKALPTLKVIPGEAVIGTLCRPRTDDGRVRQEATRLLARLPVLAGEALQTLQQLFEDDWYFDVKAHAAWGLWQSNQRRDCAVALAIADGVTSTTANLKLSSQPTLIPLLVELLKDADSFVRYRAAEVLGGWGLQAQAVPVLVELLKHADRDGRYHAAYVLGGWDPQAMAVPVLVELLRDADSTVRSRAADVLRGWGCQVQAVPMLVELLKDADSDVRSRVAYVLGGWGHQAQAVPVLVELLKNADSVVRLRVADVLGGWGYQAQAVPMLIELLKDANRYVRSRAAETLGDLGHQAQAVPVLVELLKNADSVVRLRAADVLGGWSLQAQAVSVLVELLKHTDRDGRYQAAEVLGGWGKDEVAVRAVVSKLFRAKGDAEIVVQFLLAAANGGAKQRSDKINQLLVKGLKPNGRDSDERRALRQILFRWTWDALATTA